MTPTRFLISQIVVVYAVVIGGLWLATQWTAFELGYQPQLGAPSLELLSWPVYYPWRLFEWWYAHDACAPALFGWAGIMAASSGVAGIFVAIIGSLWRARQSRLSITYGSWRWASWHEIEAREVLNKWEIERSGTCLLDRKECRDWREAVRAFFGIDFGREPERVRRVYDDHFARATSLLNVPQFAMMKRMALYL